MSGKFAPVPERKTGSSGTASFFEVAGTPAEVLFGSCKNHTGPYRICPDRVTGDLALCFGEDHEPTQTFDRKEDRKHGPPQHFSRKEDELALQP